METHLLLAHRLGYLEEAALAPFTDQAEEVRRLLRGLIKSLR